MKLFNLLFVLLFLPLSLLAQPTREDDIQTLMIDVVYLSSDLMEGRQTGTRGEELAAKYIATRLAELGLRPAGEKGTYYQNFPFQMSANPHMPASEGGTGRNVAGFLDNKAANTIIIGAHYDHLGLGIFGSLHTGDKEIHNGADDNSSGIAAMLLLAEKLGQSKAKKNNYLFVAFSGEELGLFGSKHFVKNLPIEPAQVNYMINMDMVGRLNEEGVLVINGAGTSPAWAETLPGIEVAGVQIKTTESGIGPSDHTSFYLENIPVLHFFTGQHSDYHKPSDDSELVNYEGLLKVSDFILQLVEKLDKKGKLEFVKTREEQSDRQAASFKVTLGVMPDYTYTGEGMRIDGVTDGRPAQLAGLQKGDIVVRMGNMEVKDIYGYMDGLSKFSKGDTTTVTVLREGKEMPFEVTF